VGRVITFDIAAQTEAVGRSEVEAMCERLLANPVIESWQVEVASGAAE
jgi:phosphoribosylformylglycinamidine synthase PurS subunit